MRCYIIILVNTLQIIVMYNKKIWEKERGKIMDYHSDFTSEL